MSELFSELTVVGKLVKEWDMALECGNGQYRLYTYKMESEHALVITALRLVNHDDDWDCDETLVEVIIGSFIRNGTVNYMTFTPRNLERGHVCALDLDAMALILKKIREFEIIYSELYYSSSAFK
jgi:hypothetical protein